MQAGESLNAVAPTRERLAPIASWIHFAGFLAIMAAICALGFYAQLAASGSSAAGAGQLASHGYAIQIYLTALFMDWALLYFCWVRSSAAVSKRPVRVGRVGRDVLTDLAVALPFWIVCERQRRIHWLFGLLGSGGIRQVDRQPPAQKPR